MEWISFSVDQPAAGPLTRFLEEMWKFGISSLLNNLRPWTPRDAMRPSRVAFRIDRPIGPTAQWIDDTYTWTWDPVKFPAPPQDKINVGCMLRNLAFRDATIYSDRVRIYKTRCARSPRQRPVSVGLIFHRK